MMCRSNEVSDVSLPEREISFSFSNTLQGTPYRMALYRASWSLFLRAPLQAAITLVLLRPTTNNTGIT